MRSRMATETYEVASKVTVGFGDEPNVQYYCGVVKEFRNQGSDVVEALVEFEKDDTECWIDISNDRLRLLQPKSKVSKRKVRSTSKSTSNSQSADFCNQSKERIS